MVLLAIMLGIALVPILLVAAPSGGGMAIQPAFVVIAAIAMGAIWIDGRLFPGTRELTERTLQIRCRGCGYSLEGLNNAIIFPHEIEDPPSSGPERCPECGRRWPLLI